MLKWTGRTARVAAVAMMTLGCVRGLAAPTAAVEPQGEPLKPVSVNAGIMPREVTVLWHDIGVYRASGPLRLAGPIYEMTSYETMAECEAAQQTAMAKEALSRVGSATERLSDGIKTWDSDRQYYTTFRYLCQVAGARRTPFR